MCKRWTTPTTKQRKTLNERKKEGQSIWMKEMIIRETKWKVNLIVILRKPQHPQQKTKWFFLFAVEKRKNEKNGGNKVTEMMKSERWMDKWMNEWKSKWIYPKPLTIFFFIFLSNQRRDECKTKWNTTDINKSTRPPKSLKYFHFVVCVCFLFICLIFTNIFCLS